MTTKLMVIMLTLMSFSGIAHAERQVNYPGIGEINESTAAMIQAVQLLDEQRREVMKNRRSVAEPKAEETVPVSAQNVSNNQIVETEVVPVEIQKVSTASLSNVEDEKINNSQVADKQFIAANLFSPPPKPPAPTSFRTDPSLFSQYWWDKHTFLEFSAYAGYYNGLNSSGTSGFWWMGEGILWYTQRREPENFGLGVIYKGDYGDNKSGYKWGSNSIGPVLAYYRGIGADQDLNLKFRPMYRFNHGTKANGFMPGAYAEYGLSFDDYRLSLVFDGQYFKDDSFFSTGPYLEKWINPDLKVKAGFTLNANFLSTETILGFGPSISVKLYDRFVLGASANFFKGGTTLGFYAGYEINTDLKKAYEVIQESGVEQTSEGTSAPIEEVKLTKDKDGTYATLPGASEMQSTGKTVQQILDEKKSGGKP